MGETYLRLRQICLVARDLGASENLLADVLGIEVCYRDPGVGKYGLHNALFAIGGTFLEVVSPIREGTAADRYLERRSGDGGYMFIVDCDNLEARREHFKGMGARIVEDLKSGDPVSTSEAIHLHPRDTGGCLLSIDRHSGGLDLEGGYHWAGPDWQAKDRSATLNRIIGAEIQSDDPKSLGERWSALLERPLAPFGPGKWEIALDHGFARVVPSTDKRGEGLAAVHLDCADPVAVIMAARHAGLPCDHTSVDICGVRFILSA
ncbi:MAG: hypothetical protein SGJ21_14610 [Alphaproteobacteria bacterium]|nr:hypothetical protein [Alphaproteobacteria bacterium]